MKKQRFLDCFALLLFALLVSRPLLAEKSYEYPGKWEVSDENGKTYDVFINLGGSASSTKKDGQLGSWTFTNNGIRIAWTDGTIDTFYKSKEGYKKAAPGAFSPSEIKKVD